MSSLKIANHIPPQETVPFEDQIVCGDAINVMRKIPDASVDLVVASPPYQEFYWEMG